MHDSEGLEKLATLALQLLSIPSSNADCERVFSLIMTDFWSNLHTESVSLLVGVHFNSTAVHLLPLLQKAKLCKRFIKMQ